MVIKVIECIDFNVTLNNEVMLSVTTHAIAHTHVHKLTRAHTQTHTVHTCACFNTMCLSHLRKNV